MEGWIIPVIIGVVLLWAIVIYNKFVSLRAQGDSSWSDIDVQLKRRYNLIPNLVETVKGYATHEKETLEQVVKARQLGIDASMVQDQAAAEGSLATALRQIFALSEAYPRPQGQHQLPRAQDAAFRDRGRHPECPALLQCRDTRLQHQG